MPRRVIPKGIRPAGIASTHDEEGGMDMSLVSGVKISGGFRALRMDMETQGG
jgi:hypothetical protein